MQSRRDQLQAYRFVNRRALAALVSGEPDVIDPPMRRLTITTISGIMIAILIAVVFALLGVIKPTQGDKWKAAGTVIVERETGARYVYVNDVLHPALNYSSAVLAVSTSGSAKVVLVDRSDLKKAKRGPAIGIAGLPDSLPSAKNLAGSPWTVCSRQSGNTDQLDASVSVSVGNNAGAQPLPADRALVVRSVSSTTTYLLWQGKRLAIGSTQVARSLGLQTEQTLQVGTALLNALTPGPALRAPDIPSAGARATTPVSNQFPIVGQLLRIDENTYYVVLRDGVAPVTPLQQKLLATLPIGANRTLLQPIDTPNNVALNLPQSTNDAKTLATQFTGLPTTVPPLVTTAFDNGGLCVIYADGSAKATLALPPSLLGTFRAAKVVESVASRQGLADSIILGPGRAALVKASDGGATVFLVAEPGKKFALASAAVLSTFGYDDVTPVQLPAQLLPMLPTGPALDPDQAKRTAAS